MITMDVRYGVHIRDQFERAYILSKMDGDVVTFEFNEHRFMVDAAQNIISTDSDFAECQQHAIDATAAIPTFNDPEINRCKAQIAELQEQVRSLYGRIGQRRDQLMKGN